MLFGDNTESDMDWSQEEIDSSNKHTRAGARMRTRVQ